MVSQSGNRDAAQEDGDDPSGAQEERGEGYVKFSELTIPELANAITAIFPVLYIQILGEVGADEDDIMSLMLGDVRHLAQHMKIYVLLAGFLQYLEDKNLVSKLWVPEEIAKWWNEFAEERNTKIDVETGVID